MCLYVAKMCNFKDIPLDPLPQKQNTPDLSPPDKRKRGEKRMQSSSSEEPRSCPQELTVAEVQEIVGNLELFNMTEESDDIYI